MPQNPFYIQPGSPLKGFQALQEGVKSRVEYEREKAEETRKQKIREEAVTAEQSKDYDKLSELTIKNPWLTEEVEKSFNFKNEVTKQNALESARRILQGEDPTQVLTERGEVVLNEGGDAQETIALAEQAQQDPKQARAVARATIAYLDPKASKELRALEGKDKEPIKKQKTGAFLVKDKDDNISIAVGSYNTETGKLQTETAELEGEVVSKLGETGLEETKRKIGQVRGETTARGEEVRASDLISRGVLAAESTATIRRAIDLLDTIRTGGIAAVQYAAKRFFGVEGADEGELSNSLGKAVLSQLRETFGAQFTESEGKRLERIEAGFTKSPEANKRLLKQVLKIAERTAKRARKAAMKRGDEDTVADIDELLDFELSTDNKKPEPTDDGPATELSDEELMNRAFGSQ